MPGTHEKSFGLANGEHRPKKLLHASPITITGHRNERTDGTADVDPLYRSASSLCGPAWRAVNPLSFGPGQQEDRFRRTGPDLLVSVVAGVPSHSARPSGLKPDITAGHRAYTMQPPRRCTTQFRCLELGVPRNAQRPTDLRVSIPPTGRPPAGSPLFSSTGSVGLHLSSPDTRTQITRRADQRFNGGGGIVCELRVLPRRVVSRSLPLSDVRLWRCRSREVVSGSAIRVTEPEGDVLLTDREHLLSRLTPHSEHLDRAASTAHLRLATLADLARHRRGFGSR